MSCICVLVTGGAGYIGSHVCKALATANFQVVAVDNLSTGHQKAAKWGVLEVCDIRDTARLKEIFASHKPHAVMHFAASAYVHEAMLHPLKYYSNNVAGTLSLLQAATAAGVEAFILASTCATYGIPTHTPIHEGMPTAPVNPYGETKLACERLLHWTEQAHGLKWMALRYFNVAGADPEGEIGELHDPETHLIPLALRAAAGTGPALRVFGDDYPTLDGTAIRDYIHVADLTNAHVKALKHLLDGRPSQFINLGTGQGYSVRQVIDSVQKVTRKTVPYQIAPRRVGDPPELWADPGKASQLLGWQACHTRLDDIIASAWVWEQRLASE